MESCIQRTKEEEFVAQVRPMCLVCFCFAAGLWNSSAGFFTLRVEGVRGVRSAGLDGVSVRIKIILT